MNHAGELISAYLDGELTRSEVEGLVGHLGSCGKCSAEAESLQSVRAAVRSLPALELPAGLIPEADAEVIPLHRNRGFLVGAAAAVVALVIAVAAMFTPSAATISVEELNSRYGARASLDPAFGPAKVVVPYVVDLPE
ncbi:MAG TPA: zf-HC2 domain-containing protein [Acidimicrobiia bacterium]|nr:zf-HC2 domain-containing protein [Acidimicrobiia bacterium]